MHLMQQSWDQKGYGDPIQSGMRGPKHDLPVQETKRLFKTPVKHVILLLFYCVDNGS